MSPPPTVAYLGPPGTFSEAALSAHFGAHCQPLDHGSIHEVFAAVESGAANFGVVPVENSTEGAVNNTQDCLIDSGVRIVGEQIISVVHHLLAAPPTAADGSQGQAGRIHGIASHPQSLAQCRHWLQANYPHARSIECASNAGAARLARDDPAIAAIAGEAAAHHYGLEVLERGIQDQENNRTRFLVLGQGETGSTGHDKTSVLIYTRNRPGALFRILEPFNALGISMTRLESRPSKKAAWEYVFFIDFEGHVADAPVQELMARLRLCTAMVKLLGSYAVAADCRPAAAKP